jgi:hypothetical protein
MCHDGTGLRGGRAEARLLGVLVKNGPPQTALERRSGRTPTVVILKNRSILADIAVALLEPGDDQVIRRSRSKSGSGRWSHWDEIGWSHSDEIRGSNHSKSCNWRRRGAHRDGIVGIRGASRLRRTHILIDLDRTLVQKGAVTRRCPKSGQRAIFIPIAWSQEANREKARSAHDDPKRSAASVRYAAGQNAMDESLPPVGYLRKGKASFVCLVGL